MGGSLATPALRTLSSVSERDTQDPLAAPLGHDRAAKARILSLAASCALLCTQSGCSGSPSRNILGSYFPSWMVCALVGLVVALAARAVLKGAGLLSEVPAPLLVLLSIGCATTFALWLVWLA
jgi:hypothetical protein